MRSLAIIILVNKPVYLSVNTERVRPNFCWSQNCQTVN